LKKEKKEEMGEKILRQHPSGVSLSSKGKYLKCENK
jgi:hypothetical protein